MIELLFVTGGAVRKVYIEDKKLSLLSAELGFVPIQIDLKKLNTKKTKEKLNKLKFTNEDTKELKALAEEGTDDEIAKDIIGDFQKKGWRLVRRKWV